MITVYKNDGWLTLEIPSIPQYSIYTKEGIEQMTEFMPADLHHIKDLALYGITRAAVAIGVFDGMVGNRSTSWIVG